MILDREKKLLSSKFPDKPTVKKFQTLMRDYYARHGRVLAWRSNTTLYRVILSELMLQQTQVARVNERFPQFLATFPTLESLARASLGEVLIAWQGLGYNRRARFLHELAQTIVSSKKSYTTPEELIFLPGIGVNTAGSVAAFAFDYPSIFIETNIRAVMIYFFCHHREDVSDKEVLALVKATLPSKNFREWYYSLMDYGSWLKSRVVNPSRQSKHHTKQSTFKGSDREIRGAIIRELGKKSHTLPSLKKILTFEPLRIAKQISNLKKERMIIQKGQTFSLPL